jgi:hypothetical protein
MKNISDLKRYQQFLERLDEGSSIEEDSVFLTVRNKVRKVAPAWGWTNWIDDLEQETILKLYKGEYRGEGSLDGYIAHILGNEIRLLWRKEGGSRRAEMPADFEESRDYASEIESRLSDRTKRLIQKSPRHLLWFIEAIVDADVYLSERDAAKVGKVTRYKVEKLKEELRLIWESMESESEPESEPTEKVKVTTAGGD